MHATRQRFRFRFDRAPLTPEGWFGKTPSRDAGAFHAGELLYVFGTLDAFPWLIDDADRAIAGLTGGWWSNFVKTGSVDVAAVCDVYAVQIDKVKQTAPNAKSFTDHRKLLEVKELDVALIVRFVNHATYLKLTLNVSSYAFTGRG